MPYLPHLPLGRSYQPSVIYAIKCIYTEKRLTNDIFSSVTQFNDFKKLCCDRRVDSVIESSLREITGSKKFALIIIIIIIKKDWQCKAGSSPKTPAPHYQPIEENKRKGK